MTTQLHKLTASSPLIRVLAAFALLLGALTVGVFGATGASADASVYALPGGAPESYAPYVASEPYNGDIPAGYSFTISCYLTGDTVTGEYGSENVWDLVSSSTPGYIMYGGFVPDADVYTGSNSPVVPPCSIPVGTAIGTNPVPVMTGAGSGVSLTSLNVGEKVAIRCYTINNSAPVTGPYGKEYIWDQITEYNGWTVPNGGPSWVPDALIYTGSNSAVVPHC